MEHPKLGIMYVKVAAELPFNWLRPFDSALNSATLQWLTPYIATKSSEGESPRAAPTQQAPAPAPAPRQAQPVPTPPAAPASQAAPTPPAAPAGPVAPPQAPAESPVQALLNGGRTVDGTFVPLTLQERTRLWNSLGPPATPGKRPGLSPAQRDILRAREQERLDTDRMIATEVARQKINRSIAKSRGEAYTGRDDQFGIFNDTDPRTGNRKFEIDPKTGRPVSVYGGLLPQAPLTTPQQVQSYALKRLAPQTATPTAGADARAVAGMIQKDFEQKQDERRARLLTNSRRSPYGPGAAQWTPGGTNLTRTQEANAINRYLDSERRRTDGWDPDEAWLQSSDARELGNRARVVRQGNPSMTEYDSIRQVQGAPARFDAYKEEAARRMAGPAEYPAQPPVATQQLPAAKPMAPTPLAKPPQISRAGFRRQ